MYMDIPDSNLGSVVYIRGVGGKSGKDRVVSTTPQPKVESVIPTCKSVEILTAITYSARWAAITRGGGSRDRYLLELVPDTVFLPDFVDCYVWEGIWGWN